MKQTQKRFKKITKWSNKGPNGIRWDDGSVMLYGFLCAIPFIGFFLWVISLLISLSDREVYWVEDKKNE